MKISRSAFLKAGLGVASAVVAGCSDGGADGGTGGTASGGTGGTGTGGTTGATGGASTGGASSGGSPTTGGASSGGAASGGNGTGGAGTGDCSADLEILSSMTQGEGAHQHLLIVTAAVLTAGAEVTIETEQGEEDPGGNHCHQVTLTAADIATINAGGTVKKITCNFGDHEFVITCDADPEAPVPPTTCVDESGACGG